MNIKSLLLGSAAAMVAASAAQAADAIVYEPEPVEYVRVCDAYGAGFFYIPGTETCLAISGYVRMQVGGETWKNTGDSASYLAAFSAATNDAVDGYAVRTRGRVNFDARSDTEWGTLRSYVRIQGTWGTNTDGAVSFDQAYIELGGLRLGYTESAWAQSQRGGVSMFSGSHSDTGMSYGYQQRHLIAYTFGGNGFAATVSVEHDDDGALGTVGSANAADWVPDVVGVVSYNAGWGGVWAKAAYDSDASIAAGRQGEWAAQLGMQYNIPNMNGSSLRLIGYYASEDNAYAVGSEFSILASYNHVFTDTFSASVGFQYFNDTNYGAVGSPDAYAAELSMIWTPVQNFEVRSELGYTKEDALDGTFSGYIRFTRYF